MIGATTDSVCPRLSAVTAHVEMLAQAAEANRPSSAAFWAAYPNYDQIPSAQNVKVWERVGGNLGKKYGPIAENSCAARVSYGLNHGGAPIPAGTPDASRNFKDQSYAGKAGDDKYYIISAHSMNAYLMKSWGTPDHTPRTVAELKNIVAGLKEGQCAVFATRTPRGHCGLLRQGYHDPYVELELPLDVWILPSP